MQRGGSEGESRIEGYMWIKVTTTMAQWLKITKKVAFPKNHQNWPFLGIFNQLLSTQNVNVARFARNVEWDFFCDFQPLCRIFAHCAVHKNVRQRPKAWEASRQVLHQSSNAFWGTLFTHGHSKKVEPPTDHPWIEPLSLIRFQRIFLNHTYQVLIHNSQILKGLRAPWL